MLELAFGGGGLAMVLSLWLGAVVVCVLPFALVYGFLAGLFDWPGGLPDPPRPGRAPDNGKLR